MGLEMKAALLAPASFVGTSAAGQLWSKPGHSFCKKAICPSVPDKQKVRGREEMPFPWLGLELNYRGKAYKRHRSKRVTNSGRKAG